MGRTRTQTRVAETPRRRAEGVRGPGCPKVGGRRVGGGGGSCPGRPAAAAAGRRGIRKALFFFPLGDFFFFLFLLIFLYCKERFSVSAEPWGSRGAPSVSSPSTGVGRVAANWQHPRARRGCALVPEPFGGFVGERLKERGVPSRSLEAERAVEGRFVASLPAARNAPQVGVRVVWNVPRPSALLALPFHLPTKYVAGSVCHSERALPVFHPI